MHRSGNARPRESVRDYPRPPVAVPDERRVVVEFAGLVVADSDRAVRVLETHHPPVFYVLRADVRTDLLRRSSTRTWCEWKGAAVHWDLVAGPRLSADAAWSYPDPAPGFAALADRLAFYPSRVDRCTVGGETVAPQPGDFYGGWITSEVAGPFKGGPGTRGW
ncbi:DUF427 domain-containing protein [Streptomyces sp. HB2AG]|uniref:DUF427 domain-containing protein n=1 Tax=Streptomyces sp. HB2AG TaxID=2983400 RepID=UPI0022AB254C|nr:DUF427 domain-containing protein [Streptomyces sp. HB2AG]MCZ2523546.1 DUF427 domain-containing protein [Streptomyces sp. HB2AG]